MKNSKSNEISVVIVACAHEKRDFYSQLLELQRIFRHIGTCVVSKEGIIQHFTMWVRNTWDSLLPEHVLGKKPPPDLKCVIQSMTFCEMTYISFSLKF